MRVPIVSRFIAGKTMSDAINNTSDARIAGVGTIFNLLGEHYTDPRTVEETENEYLELLSQLEHEENTCISVKPSQLGSNIRSGYVDSVLAELVEKAHECGVFVWVDMEKPSSVDDTLTAVEHLGSKFPDTVGVCLQANLKRTNKDISRLSGTGVSIRLVKGAYEASEQVAYQSQDTIDDQYHSLMHTLFTKFDGNIAVGTHDSEMIAKAKELSELHDKSVQFQMLRGVREDEQRKLAEAGYDIRQYAPYGTQWPSYIWRRFKESRRNLWFILKAVVSQS